MTYLDNLARASELIASACQHGVTGHIRQTRPSSPTAIRKAERKLEVEFPDSLREAYQAFGCDVDWRLNDERSGDCPEEWTYTAYGHFGWRLNTVLEAEPLRRGFMDDIIGAPKCKEDELWNDKLAFLCLQGGYLALDLTKGGDPPVIFLSDEHMKWHGLQLASTLNSFFENWFALGCVGPEEMSFYPFTRRLKGRLDANGSPAKRWRKWLAGG